MENRATTTQGNGKTTAQETIERAMHFFGEKDRWESMYLFSSEGLLMAREGKSDTYNEENLLEFAFSLIETVQLLGGNVPVKEIAVRGKERKMLIFQYIEAWGESIILAAVISGKRGYRRAMNQVVKQIQKVN
jgi:hypothetical protein